MRQNVGRQNPFGGDLNQEGQDKIRRIKVRHEDKVIGSWVLRLVLVMVLILSFALGSGAGVAAEEKAKIEYFSWLAAEVTMGKCIEELVQIFEILNPNVDVEVQAVTFGDKLPIFLTRSQGGQAPSLSRWTDADMQLLISKGLAADLKPFIDEEGPGFLDQWIEGSFDLVIKGDQVFGMPEENMPVCLVYNQDLYRIAGLDPDGPPGTREEFLEYAKKLTRDTDGDGKTDQWGFGMIGAKTPALFLRFDPWFWGPGGEYIKMTANGPRSALDTAEALDGFRFFIELYTKHEVVPPGPTSAASMDVRRMWVNEMAAMGLGGGFEMGAVSGINPEWPLTEKLRLAAVPVPAGGKKVTAGHIGYYALSPECKNPEAAWRFLRFMTNHFAQARMFEYQGFVAGRKDIVSSYKIQNNNFARVSASEAVYGKFPPQIPEWSEAREYFLVAIQEALTGVKSPGEALLDAHEEINRLLERAYGG